MRKNSLISGMLLSAVIVAVIIFAACQKDQSTVSKQTASASSENTNIVGVAGGASSGIITPLYAGALVYNYNENYHEKNQPQYVAFSAADLTAFIANLQKKYGTDVIYVNFGVYGPDAPAPNSKDDGRLTVFFSGNKIPAPTSNRKADGTVSTLDNFLNHGDLIP